LLGSVWLAAEVIAVSRDQVWVASSSSEQKRGAQRQDERELLGDGEPPETGDARTSPSRS
jgi:hypothetical protein